MHWLLEEAHTFCSLAVSQLHSPPFVSVSPGTPIPFLLRLVVRAKKAEGASASSTLTPALPLDGSNGGPTFTFTRLVRNQSKKSKFGTRSKLDLTTKLPVYVRWSCAHLDGARASSSGSAGVAGPGHGWTPCVRDAKASSFPYTSTALLSGFMFFPLSPSFELPTLSVSYTLHLTLPSNGQRNKLEEQLCVVRASSGVRVDQLAFLTTEEANQRALVTRQAALLQTLHKLQGDAHEVQKLIRLTTLAGNGEKEEGWDGATFEQAVASEKEQHQMQDLSRYNETVDTLHKSR